MDIKPKNIKISELVEGYVNNEEEGVIGYGGKLNIRPQYQREFVYKEKERNAVIDTLLKGFPLSIFYWAVSDDGTYEILDGQQRTISISKFIDNDFSVKHPIHGRDVYFHSLTDDEQKKVKDYKILVYFCEGDSSEKLAWFEIINIAGVPLEDQELRNAIYSGSWVTSARSIFSKTGCYAYNLGGDYLNGRAIRQDYLETVIRWISDNKIEEYMSSHQHDVDADDLKNYFTDVINWVKEIFPIYRDQMKGRDWGYLYNNYKDSEYDPDELESKVKDLFDDDEVTNQKGIFDYLISGDEKTLSLRQFDKKTKAKFYERQNGICVKPDGCEEQFELNEMEADHITPWSKGGKTIEENCQVLCKSCNNKKRDN